MSTNNGIQSKAAGVILVLAMSLALELSSPVAVSASITTDQSVHGQINCLWWNHGGDTGRLMAEEEGDLMLLAGNSTLSRAKAKPCPTLSRAKAKPKACLGLSKTKAADPGRVQQERSRGRGQGVDRAGSRGKDDSGGDDNGHGHGHDDKGKDDKKPEIRVNEHGFIGHRFDFLEPNRRGPAGKKSKNSEDSSKDGMNDSGFVDQEERN